MATKPNRLDQVTKLLRDQLKDIEQEERELRRAKDRVLKGLGLFVKDPTGGPNRAQTVIAQTWIPNPADSWERGFNKGLDEALRRLNYEGLIHD